MSRNPVAAYTHRNGFRMGQVEFKDFLWEALLDPAASCTMGDTAENLARQYQITRARGRCLRRASFERAAGGAGRMASSMAKSSRSASEKFELATAISRAASGSTASVEALRRRHPSATVAGRRWGRLSRLFGGVQTGGNSSAIVDGAAAALVCSGAYRRARNGKEPLARLVAGVAIGCAPEIMGIGPVPAIRALLARSPG